MEYLVIYWSGVYCFVCICFYLFDVFIIFCIVKVSGDSG